MCKLAKSQSTCRRYRFKPGPRGPVLHRLHSRIHDSFLLTEAHVPTGDCSYRPHILTACLSIAVHERTSFLAYGVFWSLGFQKEYLYRISCTTGIARAFLSGVKGELCMAKGEGACDPRIPGAECILALLYSTLYLWRDVAILWRLFAVYKLARSAITNCEFSIACEHADA